MVNFVALQDRQALRQNLVTLGHRREVSHLAEFVRIVPRGGAEFDASLRCTAVRSPQTHELTAARWLLRDLTEYSRAEAERLRLVVDSLEDYAIFTLDDAGRVTHWNRGAEQILGYPEVEAVGSAYETLFTPEDRGLGVPQRELTEAKTDGPVRQERWHARRDGTRFFAQGVLARLPVSSVSARGFVKVLRDVTDRKRMEDALRESSEALEEANRTLEARVAERTAALAEANETLRDEVERRRRSEEARRP